MLNPNQYADFIWNIKEYLRDDYAEKEYEDVILPFTLLRRIDCVLERTHEQVRNAYERYKNAPHNTRELLLKKAAGHNFYNISRFTLTSLLQDQDALDENFNAYLNGFSENIKDIFYNFSGGKEKGLSPIYETLFRKDLLFQVTREFTNVDLHPEVVDNHNMGTVFEVLIRKSKETSNEKAGQYYTPREVVQLMVNIVFANERAKLSQAGAGCMIYDPACGTGGMLTTAKDHLLTSINPNLDVYLFGQELKEQTYAICKADVLIKGEQADNIKQGNTISKDQLPGKRFHYMLTNPPFGEDWKKIADVVEAEEGLGEAGRFSAGTPDKSDGSLLFLQHMISKMEPSGSIIGIVFNGSPLFNGDAGSGPSNIRKWIIENDWLDCIVALPKDLFYGTNIGTYIWFVNNNKPQQRQGKVQLINATSEQFYTPLRRSLGKKMVEISAEQIQEITQLYADYADVNRLCKMFDNEDFGYTKVTVDRPLSLAYHVTDEQIEALKTLKAFQDLARSKKKDPLKAQQEIDNGRAKQQEFLEALEVLKDHPVRVPNPDRVESPQNLNAANNPDRVLNPVRVESSIRVENPILSDHDFMRFINQHISFKLSKAWIKHLRNTFGRKNDDPTLTGFQTLSGFEIAKVLLDPLATTIPDAAVMDAAPKAWYEADSDVRDTESIPLKQDIDEYFRQEVLPYAPDAWMDRDKDKVGYTISFTKYFYEYTPLRDLDDIMAEFKALDDETEEMIEHIED